MNGIVTDIHLEHIKAKSSTQMKIPPLFCSAFQSAICSDQHIKNEPKVANLSKIQNVLGASFRVFLRKAILGKSKVASIVFFFQCYLGPRSNIFLGRCEEFVR